MNVFLSEKIRKLSSLSTLLIVILHGQLIEYSSGVNEFFQLYCTQGITRIAVPLFFMISGYLYFHNIDSFSWSVYKTKTTSRIRSLLIPFVIWSILGLLFVYVFQTFIPSSFKSAGNVRDYDFVKVIYTILWKPIGTHQLWFIRDLFCVFLLSPIVYYANRYVDKIYLSLLFALWILGEQHLISIESVFFVSLGAWIAIRKHNLMEYRNEDKKLCIILGLLWIILCFIVQYFNTGYTTACFCIITGLVFIWLTYDSYPSWFKWVSFLKYPFFIYCSHELLMTVIKGVLLRLSNEQFWIFMAYMVVPLITILLCMSIAYILSKYLPNMYKTITGGR